MIEPDRKNGDFVSETSLGSPLGFIGGCLAVLVYAYYFFDGWLDFYFWFYVININQEELQVETYMASNSFKVTDFW